MLIKYIFHLAILSFGISSIKRHIMIYRRGKKLNFSLTAQHRRCFCRTWQTRKNYDDFRFRYSSALLSCCATFFFYQITVEKLSLLIFMKIFLFCLNRHPLFYDFIFSLSFLQQVLKWKAFCVTNGERIWSEKGFCVAWKI